MLGELHIILRFGKIILHLQIMDSPGNAMIEIPLYMIL